MPDEDNSKRNGSWVAISAFLVAAILVFDFFTKGIGLVEIVWSYITDDSTPKVLVEVQNRENAGSCLTFSFENIPSGFALGTIEMDITDPSGPTPISGEMASQIQRYVVNQELEQTVLVGAVKSINFDVELKSDTDGDAFYLDYCPTLGMPGMMGKISVTPSLISPTGETLTGLNMNAGPFVLTLVRPKNADVTLETSNIQIIQR